MRIFVYEWIVGGGFLDRAEPAPVTLQSEGLAMLQAVAQDFARLSGVSVTTLLDATLSLKGFEAVEATAAATPAERDRQLRQMAKEADAVVVIAPELEGVLLALTQTIADAKTHLLTPGPELVAVASDKHETIERLYAAGVRVPQGIVVMPGERTPAKFRYPGVLKRIDGAGAIGVSRVSSPSLVPDEVGAYRLEQYVPGTPTSVAVICGSAGHVPLVPTEQHLASDDTFGYLGGRLPLARELHERATSLALATLRALPPSTGYVGVDMVLGDADDGSQDFVIEVNPRFTTSYVGLRAATDANLAELILHADEGKAVEAPLFTRSVKFTASGNIEVLPDRRNLSL